MLKLGGVEVTPCLPSQEHHAQLQIVAMTAKVLQEDCGLALATGMNDYLAKPINPELLWQVLIRKIAPRQGQGRRARKCCTRPC